MESLYEHEKQKNAALEKALLEQEINFSAEKDLLIGEIKNMRKNEEIYELKIKQERELRKKEEDKINEFNEGNILLQDEGPRTAFRNIKLRVIKKD